MNLSVKSLYVAALFAIFSCFDGESVGSDTPTQVENVQPESGSEIPFEPSHKATSAIITDVVYMNGGLTITFAGRWDNDESPEKQDDCLLQTFHLWGDERLNQKDFVSILRAAEQLKGRRSTISLKSSLIMIRGGVMLFDISTTKVQIIAGPLPVKNNES